MGSTDSRAEVAAGGVLRIVPATFSPEDSCVPDMGTARVRHLPRKRAFLTLKKSDVMEGIQGMEQTFALARRMDLLTALQHGILLLSVKHRQLTSNMQSEASVLVRSVGLASCRRSVFELIG